MTSVPYISVTEFKQYNPEIDFSNYTDPTISGMIQRASAQIDNFLQYSLTIEDVTNETNEAMVSSNGNLVIYTRKFPVQSVASISLKLGTVHLDLNLTDGSGNPRYDIPSRGRSITYPYQEISMTGVFSIRNFLQLRDREIFSKIAYRAGYETIPDDIKDACNLWTKDIFIRQANPMDIRSVNQGGIAMSFRDRGGDLDNGDSTWIKQAKSILQSYRKYIG